MPWDIAVLCLAAQSCLTLCGLIDCSSPSSSVPGILQNTGVGCHALLQGIFPTQGLLPTLYVAWQSAPGSPLTETFGIHSLIVFYVMH